MLILNFISTLFMTGVIWFVQIVHYPSFSRVGTTCFTKYHALHTSRITPVVAPVMIFELITSTGLIIYPPHDVDPALLWFGLMFTLAVWSSTIFLQVPAHKKLSGGFDDKAHVFLVKSNWIRTVAWTLHSFLVGYLVWRNLK